MQTIALPSPGTRQPTMLSHGVMNNKYIRKVQFGGFTRRHYREVRLLIERQWKKEEIEG